MSRSIHTTTKALIKERIFAATDDVADKSSITELERQDIQKRCHKINEGWKRSSVSQDTILHAKMVISEEGPKRTIQHRKGRLSD